MKITQRTYEQIKKRCEKLESLGFVCRHEDSDVIHPEWSSITFDFSAINLEKTSYIMKHTIRSVYKNAFEEGEKSTQDLIKKALGV